MGTITRVLAAAVTAALAFNLSPSAGNAEALKKFRLGWPSPLSVSMAHISFGTELGLFKDQGLEIEVSSSTQGSFLVMQQLLAGNYDGIYVALESPIIGELMHKTKFPLIFTYNYIRRSLWEIAVLDDSPIRSVADLRGKTIGVGGVSWGNVPITKALLASSGIKAEDFNFVGVGVGGPAFRALTTKQVDALNLYETMHATLEANGVKLRRVPLPAEYTDHSSQGFAFRQDQLAGDPELIVKFGKAMAESTIACNANIEGCVRAFWKENPTLKPIEGTEEDKLRRDTYVVRARMARLLWFREGEPEQIGRFSDSDFKLVIRELQRGEIIPTTDIAGDRFYSNDFVGRFNDFNKAAIVAAATAYR
jgi:NitT/TauT family transport system substrate-binding protein